LSSKPSELEALRALTPRERARLVGAVLVLPIAHLLLRTAGYTRSLRLGERLSPTRTEPADAEQRATTTTRLVWIAARKTHLPSTCLSRSLALWYLLRLQGVPTEIQIGVQAGGATLDAHAWVVQRGRVLNDDAELTARYAVVPAPPRHG
jgi:hypothetical protein